MGDHEQQVAKKYARMDFDELADAPLEALGLSNKDADGRCCVAPTQEQGEAATSVLDQIARANSSNATDTRRFAGSSAASS
jgi:hypothetical protein